MFAISISICDILIYFTDSLCSKLAIYFAERSEAISCLVLPRVKRV